jgi:hypothetical protein
VGHREIYLSEVIESKAMPMIYPIKINWALEDKQEMIDTIETVYQGAKKGRGLVISLKDYSTKYKY